ncbi:conjugal transfer protein TraA (plasmid) [Pantoea agglomerans]|uniref:type IV conjugative transfer system pilin TraA n=1 Tax=Enterobacter agglomerans TaxID=549 RepID=UPI00083D44DA|nr:type IV conjugative transfer system pilin TraA [Pantoea agglomerans]AOE42643.1 conjugal transfer protein TraA [Pantoea agglomerans]
MKVVTSHPALVQGSAEACPPHSGAAAQELTGIARRAFTLLHRYRANVLLVCLALAAFALPHLAGATDLLASQKQDAKDTFGHGSTVEWGLYIGEVILSVAAYIKVRNPMILVGGIPFLIVITKVFFSLAG